MQISTYFIVSYEFTEQLNRLNGHVILGTPNKEIRIEFSCQIVNYNGSAFSMLTKYLLQSWTYLLKIKMKKIIPAFIILYDFYLLVIFLIHEQIGSCEFL